MQTRMDAETVVFHQKRVVSQTIRNAKVQNHKANRIIKSQSIIRNQKSECRQNRQGLDKNRYPYQKGVMYNISINWLTSNRLRVKINILMGKQTKEQWYIYRGILNILRGSWEVRAD